MPVVLILAASLSNLLLLDSFRQPHGYKDDGRIFLASLLDVAGANAAAVEGAATIDSDAFLKDEFVSFAVVDSAYLLNANNPLSNVLPTRDGLMIYKIQSGDNLSKIAANFGISLNTIFWANPNIRPNTLSVGQEIIVLPVTGVLHSVQSGETLDTIAIQYSVDVKKIVQRNPGAAQKLAVGNTIIVPDAQPIRGQRSASASNLPDYPGYFAIPTTGWNWGRLHNFNAVDIANACGTPIYAAAEGLVVEAPVGGWNEGYGNYIMLEHPNGAKTRYAHNQKNNVSVGDYISKGDVIGYIGNTGNTHGPTGCHLHFEIRGAKNPFAK